MIPEFQLINRGSRSARTVTGVLIAAACVVLAGCSTYDSLTQRIAQRITPYRITVVQGNFVSKEAAAQMRVGMSRAEVKQLLGTPLLTDMFHDDRWDYIFYFKRGSTSVVQQRDFIVNFAGDRVASWSGGDDLPSNLELLAEIDGDKSGKKAKPVAAAPASAASAAPAAAAAPASAPYAPTVPDTAGQPGVAADAAALPQTDPNAQAAQAANRATNAVQTPSAGGSSARANAPRSGVGVPSSVDTTPQQQIQLRRKPAPAPTAPESNPVGPTGTQDNSSTAPTHNAPLTSSPTSSNGQGAGG